jgi:type I restriction enzyme S subunit
VKNNLIPEIRFSGFTGDWEERKLGDMYDVVSGYAFKMSDYIQNGVPIINGESIQHGSISTKNSNFLPEGFLDKYQNFILNTGDIVLGLNRPIINGNLKIAQVPKDLHGALLYQRAGKITILNNASINFSYQLLGNEVSKFVLEEAVGSDQPFISTTKLKKWLICIPASEEEQTKIGNFFKQLDDTIALHQQEINTLKQTKQGFLQKMLPKEGESVPEMRFPRFTGDWELRKLGNHAEILTGGTPKTQIKEYWEPREIPWMSSGEVNKKRLSSTDNMISTLGLENSSARWVKENSVLIALAGQGKTRGTVATNEIPLTTNQSIAAIVPKDELHYEFIFHNLEKRYEELRLISSGDGTRGGLNKQLVSDVVILSPSIEEQTKIGNFFKQLDDTITLHQRELDALKETKKAFLQKMFV